MHLKKIINGVILTGFFLFVLFMYLSILTDNMNIKKNSVEYFILVPSAVKKLPVEQWGKLIRYHHNDVDGTTSAMDGVIFAIKQYPDKIVDVVKNYFMTKQFRVVKKTSTSIELKKANQHVSVYYHYNEETDFYTFKIMFIYLIDS